MSELPPQPESQQLYMTIGGQVLKLTIEVVEPSYQYLNIESHQKWQDRFKPEHRVDL